MYFKTRDNQNLYYSVSGNLKTEKSLVFLNGLSQSTIAWGFMIPFFEKEYKIILLDFIFQGESDKKGEWRNFDQHAQDVNDLLEHLGVRSTHMIGLSYGSLVAQHFALLFPGKLQKLVLMSTFAHKTPYFEAIETAWGRALEIGGYPLLFDVMLPSVLGEDYFKNPVVPFDIMRKARELANTDKDALLKLMRATKERGDYREYLKKIRTDTLIIHGEKDLLLPLELGMGVHTSIKGSKLKVIPKVGHTLNLEAVPQCIAIIKEFL